MRKIETDGELRNISEKKMGYIFNDYSGKGSSGRKYNVLHKALCGFVPRLKSNINKLFFDDEKEAIEWLMSNRMSNWKFCERCMEKNTTPPNISIENSSIELEKIAKNIVLAEPMTFWVSGEPSSFSTAREKPWKQNLDQQIPDNDGNGSEDGICLNFHLESMKVNGMYFDIDNLCEPVFSALINKKGWLGGKRPNLKWFRATKMIDIKHGCSFKICNSLESVSPIKYKYAINSKIYSDNLPKNATDAEFSSWVKENYNVAKHLSSFYVKIEFGSSRINLGDIATGKVKSIIDCLYPIIGGNMGSPEDWKINILEVSKGVKTISENSTRITIAEL